MAESIHILRPMFSLSTQRRFEKGFVTVNFEDMDSRATGFLISAGLIITNSHCLPRLPQPERLGTDLVFLTITPLDAPSIKARAMVVYADPCSDIAILSGPDREEFPLEANQYLTMLQSLTPLRINLKPLGRFENVEVGVRTVDGSWLLGSAFIAGTAGRNISVSLRPKEARIRPGTSGSPVFNDKGLVIGVVKFASETHAEFTALVLPDHVPAWVPELIRDERRQKRQGPR